MTSIQHVMLPFCYLIMQKTIIIIIALFWLLLIHTHIVCLCLYLALSLPISFCPSFSPIFNRYYYLSFLFLILSIHFIPLNFQLVPSLYLSLLVQTHSAFSFDYREKPRTTLKRYLFLNLFVNKIAGLCVYLMLFTRKSVYSYIYRYRQIENY